MSPDRALLPVRRRPAWLLAVAATLLLVAAGTNGGAGLDDDGYIFLRYAENIAAGHGAVFNPGERVEGYSSPLWTFILAGCALTGADLESAAIVLGVLASLGLFMALWLGLGLMGMGRGWERAALVLGTAIFPPVVYYSMSGLDHPIFTALITLSLASAIADLEGRSVSARTAILLTLSIAARNEGVLLAGWIGLLFTLVRGKLDGRWLARVVAPLAAAGAAVGAMVGARYAYYGTIFPNTYYAKVTPDTAARLGKGIDYLIKGAPVFLPLVLFAAALAALAWRRGSLPAARAALAGGWIAVWASFLVYAGGDHLPMYRFFLPAWPGVVLLAGAGWAAARPHLRGAALFAARAALVAVLIYAPWTAMKREGEAARRQPRLARGWAVHGRWLAEHTPPGTLVATNVIGAIGYFSGRPLIDMLGLTDATVAREGKVYSGAAHGHSRYDTDYLMDRAPDLVVYYTRDDIRKPGRIFTPPGAIKKKYAYALYDFVTDPRCAERYEHILAPLDDGGLIELLRKRTFPLDVLYLVAPEDAA